MNCFCSKLSVIFFCLFSSSVFSAGEKIYQIDVWADNWFSAFIDGRPLLTDSVSIETERSFNAETLRFSASAPFVLSFVVKDFKENDTGLEYIGSQRQQMGDGGFIAQVIDLDSAGISGVSDASMRCKVIHKAPLHSNCASQSNPIAGQGQCEFITTLEPDEWKTFSFDDSTWPYAVEYSAAQVRPKDGYHQIAWHSAAKLIWSDDLEKDNTLICRLAIDVTGGFPINPTKSVGSEIHSHFGHFGGVKTSEDSTYLMVESNGLPEHNTMVGIASWQQQLPLPQDYSGSNSWKIPLNPTMADVPLLTKNHFHKGAIAIAVNGVPIFNALNNRAEYSVEIGELDKWGGHSGRADDYHYHVAPLHLESVVGQNNPIGYALDGYPLYGKTEKPLDRFLGRFNKAGTYQYHAVDYAPYLIAGLRGKVEVDSPANAPEDQIVPQPRSRPVRQRDYGPLPGANIVNHTRVGVNAYSLQYSIGGVEHQVNYRWNSAGEYQFVFIDEAGNQIVEKYQADSRSLTAAHPQHGSKPRRAPPSGGQKPRRYCGDGICDETESEQQCPVDC